MLITNAQKEKKNLNEDFNKKIKNLQTEIDDRIKMNDNYKEQ
jgi:hypothetical protein